MSLATITEPGMVASYFVEKMGMRPTDTFRGVCHLAPTMGPITMDDVAVAVGYDGFIGRICCMHVVIDKPQYFSRAVVREAFEYPFHVADCEAVLGLVDSTNEAAMSFDKRLGFTEVGRLTGCGFDGGDLVILAMKRGDCRWLRKH